nr:BadF/BadG/BcrA/BcrD ATPase family protein [Cohnella hashimotonis]
MFVGIDGGGSKTACLVGDAEGRILAYGEGESANVKSRPRDQVEGTLLSLIRDTLNRAGGSLVNVSSVILGLAGGHRPSDKQRMIGFLRPHLPPEAMIRVYNDAETALAAGTWGQAGIVLIAGTGSIAHGFVPEREYGIRVGGWGYLLGDEGSGYDIGRKALMAVVRNADGIAEAPELSEAVLGHLKIGDPQQLIDLFYEEANARKRIAKLAELVVELAASGNAPAKGIVREAIQDLLRLAAAARSKVAAGIGDEGSELPLMLAGGLFGNAYFAAQFMTAMGSETFGGSVSVLKHPPVIGAYVIGLIRSGIEINELKIQSILRSWEETQREI